jgi:hypothetical protein
MDRGAIPGYVKLLLPPRQSRGNSYFGLGRRQMPRSELAAACSGKLGRVRRPARMGRNDLIWFCAKAAFLYLLVSNLEQTTAQERELREIAGRTGWDVLKVLLDHGISGASMRCAARSPSASSIL